MKQFHTGNSFTLEKLQLSEFFEAMKGRKIVTLNDFRWECQKCGHCCNGYDGKILIPDNFRTDEENRCKYVDETGKCLVYDVRPLFCRANPFSIYTHGKYKYLLVYEHCNGFGKGSLWTKEDYDKMIEYLMSLHHKHWHDKIPADKLLDDIL